MRSQNLLYWFIDKSHHNREKNDETVFWKNHETCKKRTKNSIIKFIQLWKNNQDVSELISISFRGENFHTPFPDSLLRFIIQPRLDTLVTPTLKCRFGWVHDKDWSCNWKDQNEICSIIRKVTIVPIESKIWPNRLSNVWEKVKGINLSNSYTRNQSYEQVNYISRIRKKRRNTTAFNHSPGM
jgi:hypothetical protein